MKLEQVNVGLPKFHNINGEQISTSFEREAAKGYVNVTKQGLEGDKPAVHPDAVYVYPSEHYAYWEKELSVAPNTFTNSQFGENFTTSGLIEEELHLGDILQFGDTFQGMVTSSRTPCFKFLWRMNQEASFLKQFSESGRSGFYLKVIQEGKVKAGDEITKIKSCPENVSIAELSRIVADPTRNDQKEIQNILSFPDMGPSAGVVLRKRLVTNIDTERVRTNRWKQWRDFKVTKIVDESKDVKSFYLQAVDGKPIAGYKCGQFLTVKLDIPGEEPVIRTWSLSDFTPEENTYRLSLKKESQGVASTFMHEKVNIDSVLKIKPPLGNFSLMRDSHHVVVLIAGGIGITPLLSMIKAHVERVRLLTGTMRPEVYLFYSVKNSEHFTFKDEIEKLIAENEEVKKIICFTQPLPQDAQGKDFDLSGRMTFDVIKPYLTNKKIGFCKNWIDAAESYTDYYLCGPTQFQESIHQALLDSKVATDQIFFESFKPQAGEPVGNVVEQAEVEFKRSGKTLHWDVDDGLTLLELAEQNGINPDNSCRAGVCDTCRCKIIEGNIHYDFKPQVAVDDKHVLLCSAKPASDKIIVDA